MVKNTRCYADTQERVECFQSHHGFHGPPAACGSNDQGLLWLRSWFQQFFCEMHCVFVRRCLEWSSLCLDGHINIQCIYIYILYICVICVCDCVCGMSPILPILQCMYINTCTHRYMGFMGGEKKNKTQSKTSTEGHVEFLLIPPTTHCHPEVELALSWLPRNWWMMFWRCRMNSDHQSGKPVCMLAVLHQRIPCGYTVCRFLLYIFWFCYVLLVCLFVCLCCWSYSSFCTCVLLALVFFFFFFFFY